MIILISAPSSYPSDGTTSVTDAWRQSVYHVTVVSAWNWNATEQEKIAHYETASNAIDNLRRITPDAAYLVSLLSALSGKSSLHVCSRTRPMFTNLTMKVRKHRNPSRVRIEPFR